MNQSLDSIRLEYTLATLNEEDLDVSPFTQFKNWFQQALHAEITEVNAMTLSTIDAEGQPHGRIVLLKGLENNQFIFFTNYNSTKGKDIEHNAKASLLFFWKELQRQVRIEGVLEKIPEQESTRYFQSRPRESQLGAWASNQSEVLHARYELDDRFEQLKAKYKNKEIPKPAHWGGYALTASKIEFWQGRASRLHDRIVYVQHEGNWNKHRLNP